MLGMRQSVPGSVVRRAVRDADERIRSRRPDSRLGYHNARAFLVNMTRSLGSPD